MKNTDTKIAGFKKETVDLYEENKKNINSYELVTLSSRAAKGSVVSSKDYSTKENEWFDSFCKVANG